MMLKMDVVAPMLMASAAKAAIVLPGFSRQMWRVLLMSRATEMQKVLTKDSKQASLRLHPNQTNDVELL